MRRRRRIIYVGAKRMQRDAPLLERLGTRYFRAVQTARNHYFYPLRAHTHRRRYGLFRRFLVGHALLDLPRDIVPHKLRVHLRLLHLADVYLYLFLREVLKLSLQPLDLLALLADDYARTRRMDADRYALGRALYVERAYAAVFKALAQVIAQQNILVQIIGEPLLRVPVRRPRAGYPQAQADRISFLTHELPPLPLIGQRNGYMARTFENRRRAAFCPRAEPLRYRPVVNPNLLHAKLVNLRVRAALVIRKVRRRRTYQLRDVLRHVLLYPEPEQIQSLVHVLAANGVSHQPRLARGRLQIPQYRFRFHNILSLSAYFLAALSVLVPLWPRKLRVGANSPKRWPTIFSVTYTGRNLFPL